MPTFEEVRICKWCDGFVHEHHSGDEGWSICEECSAVEAGDTTKYWCSDCEAICDEEKCDCWIPPTAKEFWNNIEFIKWRIVEQLHEEDKVIEKFFNFEITRWRLKELLTSIRFIRKKFEKRWDELNESTTTR